MIDHDSLTQDWMSAPEIASYRWSEAEALERLASRFACGEFDLFSLECYTEAVLEFYEDRT